MSKMRLSIMGELSL